MKILVLIGIVACSSRGVPAPTVASTPASVVIDAPSIDAIALDVVVVTGLCRPNLCSMDSYCVCHGVDNGPRCWSTPEDCEVDAVCCSSRDGYCNGLRLDECADVTVKARAARKGS